MNPAIFSVKPAGLSWAANIINSSGLSINYLDICWNGTTFTIVGNKSGGGHILTATNPSGTWTEQTFPISVNGFWACATNGSRIVTIGDGATNPGVYSDDNGATWTTSSIQNRTWRGLCFGNGLFMAVANGSDGASSTNGITWTSRSMTGSGWEDVFYGGGQYIAVGLSGKIATSPDAITWTDRTSGTTDDLYRVRYKAGLWCAVGEPPATGAARVLLSTDGITWTNQTLAATAENFLGLAVHRNFFIATPRASAYSARAWRSISGQAATWASATTGTPTNALIRSVASNGVNVVAAYNVTNNHGVLISS